MADGLSKGVERDDWKGEQNSDLRSSEQNWDAREDRLEFQDKIETS